MRSIQTTIVFPLSSVKPLDGQQRYRERCLAEARKALRRGVQWRRECPACALTLEAFGDVEGLDYVRCPGCGSLFLAPMAAASDWALALKEVTRYRQSKDAFHAGITQSRYENVLAPKLDWIQSTLRLQQVSQPRLLEVATPPSDVEELLEESGLFSEVVAIDEMDLVAAPATPEHPAGFFDGVLMLESLDRVSDPAALLRALSSRLVAGGLLFVTALVSSGFDVAVLGLRNLYLYPPDRANCFSRRGLELLLTRAGFTLLEVSTPGVLDVEIVQAHLRQIPSLILSGFERQLLAATAETQAAFQAFLQQHGMSSFARVVARKRP